MASAKKPRKARPTPVKGASAKLGQLKSALADMPVKVALAVARDAAPTLTGFTRAAFNAGRTVYGDPRPLSSIRIRGVEAIQGPMRREASDAAGKKAYAKKARERAKKPDYLRHDGTPLDLVKSGATKAGLRFTTTRLRVKAAFTTTYQKFLIGKYKILPIKAVPPEWDTELARLAHVAFLREAQK